MSDILFPPDLIPSTMMFGVDDFTAVDESATTGAMQSSALYGTRRWHLRMDFAVLSRKSGSLSRFEAIVAALRGRANRVWISPAQAAVRRGSFPAAEMFANNDFSGGVTPWSVFSTDYALSSLDHGVRATRVAVTGSAAVCCQSVNLVTGVPYAMRGFVNAGRGNTPVVLSDNNIFTGSIFLAQGMLSGSLTENVATSRICGVFDFNGSSGLAGNYFDVKWTSFSRCAQVDNGSNLLTWSIDLTNAAWTKSSATAAAAGSFIGPDGVIEGTVISESTTSNVQHFAAQSTTVSSAATDFTFGCFVFGLNRTWVDLCLIEGPPGGSALQTWFNLGTGALGTTQAGANWTPIKSTITNYGNGWFYCTVTGRKTSAATVIEAVIFTATADTVNQYVGINGNAAIQVWLPTLAPSSVAVAPIKTSSVAQAATPQTGFSLNLKGLPASTQGLLFEGDVVECLMPSNSQLLRVVQRLDSDSSGIGTLIFENALKQSPVDSAGIVIQQPMGRFVLSASTPGIEYSPGVFGSASLEFVEAA